MRMKKRIWPGLQTKAGRSQLSIDTVVGGWRAKGPRPHVCSGDSLRGQSQEPGTLRLAEPVAWKFPEKPGTRRWVCEEEA